jgi:hypothetical protein
VGNALQINGSALEDVSGLEKLSEIGGLDIRNNPDLVNVDGLSGLEHIYGDVNFIGFNTLLQNLDGLDNVADLGGDYLFIFENHSLPNCEAIEFRDRMAANGWSGYTCIRGNLPDGCPDDTSGC